MMYQAGIAKIDRKTKEVKTYPFPKEWQSASTQASMVSPQHSDVDGKVWTNNQEDRDNYRLDVATGKWENFGHAKDPRGQQISAYGMPTDHNNNVYQLEFGGTSIGLRNAKTGLVTHLADADRAARGRAAAGSTSRTGCGSPNTAPTASACSIRRPTSIKEWKLPTPWGEPYDVVPTKQRRGLDRLDAERPGRRGSTPRPARSWNICCRAPTNIRRVFVEETGRGRCSGSAATMAPRS